MASSRTSLDSDIITLRQVYAFNPPNVPVPSSQILISVGNGAAYWDSVSSILPISSFGQVRGTNGSTFNANLYNNVLNVSTIGVQGLLETYVDTATSTLMISNAVAPVQVALTAVPTVTRLAATQMPNAQTLSMSTTQSTLRFLGVGDIQLSTITDLRAVFFSISSFTATGYADLSGEARAWRPYTYSTNSTSAGYATFISSIPYSTVVGSSGWNWTSSIGENLLLSTVEPYPSLYSTGDVYFSTVSFHMGPFARYIHPNSTTKVYLEIKPSYFFERMYLGQEAPLTLVKEFSTFVQYESPRSGRQILSTSIVGDYMTSQMSNLYTSNYYNTPLKLELDTATLMSNTLADGATGARYTVYHRIAGGMANLVSDGYCGNVIGPRGGFSNAAPYYANRTPLQGGVFLHVYNQQGAAPPLPGP
jgi:hypothetical protein